jgi:hypothetical protein
MICRSGSRAPMPIPAALRARYQQLFHFYDRDGDDQLTLEGDFAPVARSLDARWGDRPTPFPHLLQLLLSTYAAENSRRDQDHSGSVDQEEFVNSHARVIAAFGANPEQARQFIERSAGGFFDVLDLDGDGVLLPTDLAAFASAYGHPVEGIAANLDGMLEELGLPPGQLPRQAFLTLVEQFWFDPSATTPGRRLFDGVSLAR